ncbi:winged helix-turn-helix transcriptional regulator [Sandaracinobacteroides saxicola]|uniref:Helix-turn-helix transcriptional regulator n=1 Tax=Sandaracinobacteroides saxicola TaxID=2759707 RepID=A0A7G5IIQ8_9SPHN|nr:helix-turn-helix domain-containing protein [Sandaracinobacteroides saxicola]QMW23250.1 helix-turn-helix transcriptional regulator [Sandaracinobacteroides saxicola]
MPSADRQFQCPVAATIAVAGGKWKPIIVFHLLDGTRRFGELKKLSGGASQRALTMHLRELEADGIVSRRVYAEVPPRVEYSLTERGRSLEPVLRAMKAWGSEYVTSYKGPEK